MAKKIDDDLINESVKKFYTDIAKGKEGVKVDEKDLARSIGYTEEELSYVPEEANMGLGCGNPQEKAEPKEGEVVVDLGCGKGMDVFIVSKKVGESGRVIGVDMLPDMISTARKIEKKKKFGNVEFRLGEIENLPVADNTCDIVLSNCVINLSTEKQRVYNEILRILKPGGRIGISDITLTRWLPDEVVNDPRMYGT